MNKELVRIDLIKSNKENPRLIKDHKFKKLVKSIKEFPEMLVIRPIVVNKDNIILGGNMRHKACIEAGLKEVWIQKLTKLTKEQEQEFIIKDNVGFGEWDWDILANNWNEAELKDWGLDVWQTEDIAEEDFLETTSDDVKEKNKIILEYNTEDYNLLIDSFSKIQGSKEKIVFDLIMNYNK